MQKSKKENIRNFEMTGQRRQYLEKKLKIKLAGIGSFVVDEKTAGSRNCENMIGAVQIPLGIAGPLKISGNCAKGEFYLPIATTEGALVASVNRGCKAVNLSGGVNVVVENIGVTRGPVFKTNNIKESLQFKNWLKRSLLQLKKIAQTTSGHLTLKKLTVRLAGRYVYVRFYYDTQDAMGMNMVTIATNKITEYIREKTGINCLSLAGNFDIDKKPAFLNFILGRGRQVWAEAIIENKVVEEVLKTTGHEIFAVWLAKCMLGSALSGSLGFNSHFANIIAAIFAATGQDLAHIAEGAQGITTVEILDNKSLYISIYLPDLMIGTVGGGTSLQTAKEALSLLGIQGGDKGNNALKFAEIIGAAVLAGELSLLSSLAEGSLTLAHQKLARGENH